MEREQYLTPGLPIVLDIVRGEYVETAEAIKVAMGIILLVLKEKDKEKLLKLRDYGFNELNEQKDEILSIAHQLECDAKYSGIFSNYCFSEIDRISVGTLSKLFRMILAFMSNYGNEYEFATYLFRNLVSELKGKPQSTAGEPEWLRNLTINCIWQSNNY